MDETSADAAWTATVDYGDGTGAQALPLTDHGFALSHRYAVAGSYVVAVTVRVSGGTSGTTRFLVAVSDVPPRIAAQRDDVALFVVTVRVYDRHGGVGVRRFRVRVRR